MPNPNPHPGQGAVQAKGEALWPAYRLSSRPYVGPTSLDPELAFIMANLAGAGRGRGRDRGRVEGGRYVREP